MLLSFPCDRANDFRYRFSRLAEAVAKIVSAVARGREKHVGGFGFTEFWTAGKR